MSSPIVPYAAAELLERVVIGGDLSKLEPAERLRYYREVCQSLGLNPLTRPLEYLQLSGKLTLYARRDATDQLRTLHGISVDKLEDKEINGIYIVTAYLSNAAGRKDSDMGAVPIDGLKGEARANAILKAVTKAKRRGTLSICGLGMLDETEVETLPAEAVAPIPPKAPEKRADPVTRTAETEPESGRDERLERTFNQWMVSFTRPANPDQLEALWLECHLPETWPHFNASQQVQLTAAYNAAKRRLGIS